MLAFSSLRAAAPRLSATHLSSVSSAPSRTLPLRAFSSSQFALCGCGNPLPHTHAPQASQSHLSAATPSAPQLIATRSNPFLPPSQSASRLAVSSPASVTAMPSSAALAHSGSQPPSQPPPKTSSPSYIHRMMTPQELLENNKKWAEVTKTEMPGFLDELNQQQAPSYLWIGCSDSRVPANTLVGLLPGEVFVHRNIANVVNHTDMSVLSVLQYSVEVLRVKNIMVVGHYGCGGVLAAMGNQQFGLLDNWLRSIKDLYYVHQHQLETIDDIKARGDLLCELNVARSVENVCYTSIVQNAWAKGWEVNVHGWCYRVSDGLLRDLHLTTSSPDRIRDVYKVAAPQ